MRFLSRVAALLAGALALTAQAQNLSIATGGTGGVYYPLGGGMAALLSKYVPGMQATAEGTCGSVGNLAPIGHPKPDSTPTLAHPPLPTDTGGDQLTRQAV